MLDAIAFDDAEHIQMTDTYKFFGSIRETKILAIGTKPKKGSVLEYFVEQYLQPKAIILHSYKDEIEEGLLDEAFFEDTKRLISPETFEAEYGPWTFTFNKTNEDYLHLMKKI